MSGLCLRQAGVAWAAGTWRAAHMNVMRRRWRAQREAERDRARCGVARVEGVSADGICPTDGLSAREQVRIWTWRPRVALRARIALRPLRKLAGLEVCRQQRAVLDLEARDGVLLQLHGSDRLLRQNEPARRLTKRCLAENGDNECRGGDDRRDLGFQHASLPSRPACPVEDRSRSQAREYGEPPFRGVVGRTS